MSVDWLTSEHAALVSAAATSGVFAVGVWVAEQADRATEILKRLLEIKAELSRPPPNARSQVALVHHQVSCMIEMMDQLVELEHVKREEHRLRSEANRRIVALSTRVVGAMVVLVSLTGGVLALWDRFAS